MNRAQMNAVDRTMHAALQQEHGAVLRQWAHLQRRVTDQLTGYALRVDALDREVMRLRAQLVVARSGVLWGAPGERQAWMAPMPAAHPPAPAIMNEAQEVICQTGCVGHAHVWLDADGQCRRLGQACERVTPAHDTAALGAALNGPLNPPGG